jgi:phytoene synthase
MRRVTLPVQERRVDVEAVLAGENPAGLSDLAEEIADIAAGHLATARNLRRQISRAALPALLPARLADGYLAKLKAARFNVTDRNWSAVNTRPISLMTAMGLGRF